MIALAWSDNPQMPATTQGTIGWILFWFVLGYAFYAVLYGAAGSLVSRQEEAQSMTFPITAVLIVAYLFALEAAQPPDSTATHDRFLGAPDGTAGDDLRVATAPSRADRSMF